MKISILILDFSVVFACLAVLLWSQATAEGVAADDDGSPPCSPVDRDALLRFRASILQDTTGILSSWTGFDCCGAWEGITCHPTTGRVTALQLQRPQTGAGASVFMKGSLSPSLGNLQFLNVLTISGMKKISGTIPENLSGLQNLSQLYLENNMLSGSIPSSLGRLSSLKALSLSGNLLIGQLPPSLGTIKGLVQINLSRNLLIGTMPSTFSQLQNLESLDLRSNMLSGGIPTFVGRYQNLTFLDLSYNQFSGELPVSLCSLSNAMDISLSHNKLTGGVPSQIDNLKSLRTLSISGNQLSGAIPDSLPRLEQLWYLNLSRNGFSDPLPDGLQNGLPSLLSIDLSYNRFHLGRIPDWIISRELRNVNLAGCNISGNLQPFASPDSLSSINLSDNYLTGEIGDYFTNMTSLHEIRLSRNLLTSDISRVLLPQSVLQLDLHSNQLHGSVSGLLQKASKFLQVVDISNNKITGVLPALTEGLGLKWLDISSNSISGQIPSSIWKLQSLQRIDLSRNQVTGEIPASISLMTKLEWLDISSNMLSGNIPSSFTRLVNIRHANFRANRLCGQIPRSRPFNIFPAAAYAHNLCLCGQPLPPCKQS